MALPSAIPAPVAQVAGANQGRGRITEVKNQRKTVSKNNFTGADITVRINKTGIQYADIEFKLVDCECIYCGLHLNAELPFVEDATHNFICPQCNKEFPLDLAIIEYLDESE